MWRVRSFLILNTPWQGTGTHWSWTFSGADERALREWLDSLRGYDGVILATGITPRTLNIPGADHPKVLSYVDVILRGRPVGQRVAIIGAGGIGFDVGEYLLHNPKLTLPEPLEHWLADWGVDLAGSGNGGLVAPIPAQPVRQIYLLQRKSSLHTIGNALVVSTEDDRVPAVHSQAQFLVVVANLRKLLAYRWLDYLIVSPLLRLHHLRLQTQRLMLDVERKRTVLEQRSPTEEHVILYFLGGANLDLDSIVGRA